MTYRTPDRAKETVTGTTALALAGGAPRNFRTLAAAGIQDGDHFPGTLTHRTATQWQTGIWRRSGDDIVLVRFHSSSTGEVIPVFTAGTKDILVAALGRLASPIIVTTAMSPFAALPGDYLRIDTSDGPVVVDLWEDPSDGDPDLVISDAVGGWPTNSLTINGNGTLFEGGADSMLCDDSAVSRFTVFPHGGAFRVVKFGLQLPPAGGVDDTSIVQQALDQNNGGTVVVPLGTYVVTSLTIPSDGITLIGQGPGSVIKQKAATNAHMMVSTGAGALVQLQDLTIDGNQQNQTNDLTHAYLGIRFSSVGTLTTPARLVVRNCRFINGRILDIGVYNTDSTLRTYLEITDSFFLGGCEGTVGQSAQYVYFQGSIGVLINNSTFDLNATPQTYGRAGVSGDDAGSDGEWTNPLNVTITNNVFVNLGRCSADAIGAIDCYAGGSEIVITGNRLIQPYGRGINVKSDQSAVTIAHNVIVGLNITATQTSRTAQITMLGSVSTIVGQGMVIAHNVCKDSGFDGMQIIGRDLAADSFVRNRIVADNVIINPARRCLSFSDNGTVEVRGNSLYGGTYGIYAESLHDAMMIAHNFIDATDGNAMQIVSTDNYPSCDLFVIGNEIFNPNGRAINIRYIGDCTILDNRIVVDGNSPLFMVDVTGTRLIRNNAITSDTGWNITSGTNTGPLYTEPYYVEETLSIALTHPDDGVAGGNARGANAIDLQLARSAATQVASGQYAWALGRQNTASGANAGALGVFNIASGATSMCFGSNCLSSGTNGMALGYLGNDRGRAGYQAYANGRFAATGDAQAGQTILRASTTSTTATRMTSDGEAASSSNVCNLDSSSALSLDITLLVRDTVTGDVATFQSLGVLISRAGGLGTTALTGAPTFTAIQASAGFAALVAPTIAADTTNGGLDISVVALGTNATHWVAVVKATEVQ